jgi:hypothetical protein
MKTKVLTLGALALGIGSSSHAASLLERLGLRNPSTNLLQKVFGAVAK